MSRLLLRILIAALCLPVLGIAQTAAPSSAGMGKIAWINLEQAVFTCDEGKSTFAEVQKFVDNKNAELDNLRKEAESLKNKLTVQGSKLTDEARADLEDQVEAKDIELQRFQEDTQKEIINRRDRASNYIAKRMLPVIERLSKERGFNAVFFLNSARDAWVDPSLIVTEDVVKAYNQTYSAGAAKAPSAPAPAKKP